MENTGQVVIPGVHQYAARPSAIEQPLLPFRGKQRDKRLEAKGILISSGQSQL